MRKWIHDGNGTITYECPPHCAAGQQTVGHEKWLHYVCTVPADKGDLIALSPEWPAAMERLVHATRFRDRGDREFEEAIDAARALLERLPKELPL